MIDIAKTINKDVTEINNNVANLEDSSRISVSSTKEITQGTTETAKAAQNQLMRYKNLLVM